ncbi:hypothetical protein [Paraflavitalea pollutisoli]|uniref:hypothetical protein n=1 Tax=Paraflavitalea pollutisoli TaxID=3034143 RepID=UPI0023ED86F9|nr:hypothetical protein [Paraflavitalea sp. H1-2-19X]
MGDKKRPAEESAIEQTNNTGYDNNANPEETSEGAVLPDPEEIKLGPLHKVGEEHRTVKDVDRPRDTNEGDADHDSWDFRRNK